MPQLIVVDAQLSLRVNAACKLSAVVLRSTPQHLQSGGNNVSTS
jgi:hypothetical protein